jgi:uncharacterized protein
MNIAWHAFTPWASLAGGVLIGLAAVVLLVFVGRIAGISGIVGGLVRHADGYTGTDWQWRVAFIFGLLLAPAVYGVIAVVPEAQIDTGWVGVIVAGLLVGIGTRYGAGCTSGHGICGLARFSPRSLVATLAFMVTGFITVYLMRRLLSY